jgi:hypothetical protein
MMARASASAAAADAEKRDGWRRRDEDDAIILFIWFVQVL